MENKRVHKLREAMAERELQAMLITNPINRRYMTGFTGSAGYVLITENEAYLLTDFRYMSQATLQAKGFKVLEHGVKPMDSVKDLLAAANLKEVGFEQDSVTFGTHAAYAETLQSVKLKAVSGIVEQLRMFKDADEIAVMQRAADLADATFSHVLQFAKPGMTEREVDLEMEFFMRKHGATSSSFDTIVASGERSQCLTAWQAARSLDRTS